MTARIKVPAWGWRDDLGASTRLKEERHAEAALLVLVVLARFVQLALGQLVERDAHGLEPGGHSSRLP